VIVAELLTHAIGHRTLLEAACSLSQLTDRLAQVQSGDPLSQVIELLLFYHSHADSAICTGIPKEDMVEIHSATS
jgi:hypothetical protein